MPNEEKHALQSVPRSILAGARQHYEDGLHYRDRYASRTEDIRYYLARAKGRRSVLEYGCGTGRLTLPLARAGLRVTAVDPSVSMLEQLRRDLCGESPELQRRVRVHCADMRTFSSRRRFDLVVLAFHTFCHLYSHQDIEGFLSLAYRHLAPGGELTFDLPMPHVDMEGYDPVAQVHVMTISGADGEPQLLTQRLFHAQELLMHLHFAGFERCRIRADFGAKRITQDTDIMVCSATKPKSSGVSFSDTSKVTSRGKRC